MSDLVKGTEVFDSRGAIRLVSLDRRSKKGRLWLDSGWGSGREEARGTWVPVEGNEDLLAFCQQEQKATLPLKAQVDALNHHIGQIKTFALLTAQAVATQRVRSRDFEDGVGGWKKREELLGGGLDTTDYWPEYAAILPDGIGGPIRVSGSTGSLDIAPPEQIQEAPNA